MVTNAVDFRYLLLENYKKLKLTENELVVILMIDQLISENNPLITADLLSLKMTLDPKEIDSILASLLKKHYIEYVSTSRGTATTLEPLKEILFNEFQLSMAQQDLKEKANNRTIFDDNIYTTFEKILSRNLSPVEIDKITSWLEYGHSESEIIDALKEAVGRNKKTLREVDRILLSWEVKQDRETEGVSPINKDWDKNLSQTIEISKSKEDKTGNDK